jgi:hypothetical protein
MLDNFRIEVRSLKVFENDLRVIGAKQKISASLTNLNESGVASFSTATLTIN